MKCPADNETLVMTERNGVEIDYCPKCRGVWLDRGELDKIIERAAPGQSVAPPQLSPSDDPRRDQRYDPRHEPRRDHDSHGHRPPYKKKRESFLSELFDF